MGKMHFQKNEGVQAIENKKTINKKYGVVVVGGGMSGVCAAIASARHGAKTALVQIDLYWVVMQVPK